MASPTSTLSGDKSTLVVSCLLRGLGDADVAACLKLEQSSAFRFDSS